MQTPLLTHAGPTSGPSNAGNRFGPFAAGGQTATWSSSSATARTPIARAGTISGLHVCLPVTLTTGSWAFTLVVNNVDTALTCTVSSGQSTASDTSNSVAVAAGDDVCWKSAPTSTPDAQTIVQIAAVFEGTDTGASVLFAAHTSTTVAHYVPINGAGSSTATEEVSAAVMPVAGDLTRLYVKLSAAPGAGTSRTYTVRKNGVDTALTVTIADAATTGNLTATTVSFVAGDVLSLGLTISGSPASGAGFVGLDWMPATDGESLLFCGWASGPSNAADRYGSLNGWTSGAQATETNTYNIAPVAFTLRKLRAQISTAPGGTDSWVFTARKGGASQALTTTISGASDTTANDNSNTVAIAAGDLLDILLSPVSTPASVSFARTGAVAYIAPTIPDESDSLMLMGVG